MSDVSLATKPCGCSIGVETEDPKRSEEARATVNAWLVKGYAVELVSLEEAKARIVFDCPHNNKERV